jgi:hypothetical protein
LLRFFDSYHHPKPTLLRSLFFISKKVCNA